MAHYKIGYGGTAGLEETVYANLKSALQTNYNDKLTITADDTNLTMTLGFKTLGSYVKVICGYATYPYQQTVIIRFYDSTDTEIYSTMVNSSRYLSSTAATLFFYMDVVELQNDGLLFGFRVGADGVSTYNDIMFGFIDDDTHPCIIFPARYNSGEFRLYKDDDSYTLYNLASNNYCLPAVSSTCLQIYKIFDAEEEEFLNNIYFSTIGPALNTNELKLASIGNQKFYIWNPDTQQLANYTGIILECTDKFVS